MYYMFGLRLRASLFIIITWICVNLLIEVRTHGDDLNCDDIQKQGDMNSYLWTLKRDPPSYFFGTIHVPYSKVWKYIPKNMKEAFHRSDRVFFELDFTDPDTISALSNCQLLPQGEYLSNVIPRNLYRRLKRHLEYVKDMMPTWMTSDQRGRGLYVDYLFNALTGNWERKRPVWVMVMINSLTESDVRFRGIPVLDLYLAHEAERMSKETGAVEDVEEHCVPLNQLSFSQALFALNQTLWQHENIRRQVGMETMPYTPDDLIRHYNCGDLDSVIFTSDSAQVPNIINSSLPPSQITVAKHIDDYFRHELIYMRNQRMADRVLKLLKSHPNQSFFFAFGAGHFLGNNTVLDILKKEGYDFEHTPPESNIYLGENYIKKDHPPLLADIMLQEGVSPLTMEDNIDYLDPFYDRSKHRQRHRHNRGRRKGRRKDKERGSNNNPSPTDSYNRLKRPQFNDLWVRLEATSFGPNSFFRRIQQSNTTPVTPPVPAKQSHSAAAEGTKPVVVLVAIFTVFSYLHCYVVLL